MNMIFRPSHVLKACHQLFFWLMVTSGVCLAAGLYLALVWSPPDYQQGEAVRILYLHVPCSWGSLGFYTLMAIFSTIGIIKGWFLPHLAAQACAPVGMTLGIISVLSGAIWGYPTWGTWWVWDARLTSMVLLVFLYGGFILMANSFSPRRQKAAGFLAILGWINVPIIKWSVDWWATLHQPASIMRLAKPALHWTMMLPLGVMAMALGCLSLSLVCLRLQTLLLNLYGYNYSLRRQQ